MEELYPGLFRLRIPIPRNPLKELNSYVVTGKDRNLIVDMGMNRIECEEALFKGIKELELDLSKTDLFVTHMHADHSGLIGKVASPSSTIYCSRPDADMINMQGNLMELMKGFITVGGFPPDEYQIAIEKHPGYRYRCREQVEFTYSKDGDTLSYGDYTFTVIHTPGHTMGHLCLYDQEKGILLSGDHILGDITPNISLNAPDEDPLTEYIASLDKIAALDLQIVLPGHRSIIKDGYARIEELKKHHVERANEVLSILQNNEQLNAYQVAGKMTWDMTVPFDQFPIAQKWFASGEALAHLVYLETKGQVKRKPAGDVVLFSLN
ncbi:MAG: MBL fold metallo-hydrolase [Bacillota bacterium]